MTSRSKGRRNDPQQPKRKPWVGIDKASMKSRVFRQVEQNPVHLYAIALFCDKRRGIQAEQGRTHDPIGELSDLHFLEPSER